MFRQFAQRYLRQYSTQHHVGDELATIRRKLAATAVILPMSILIKSAYNAYNTDDWIRRAAEDGAVEGFGIGVAITSMVWFPVLVPFYAMGGLIINIPNIVTYFETQRRMRIKQK